MTTDLASAEAEIRLIRSMIKKLEALSPSGRRRAMEYLTERQDELDAQQTEDK